MAYGLYGLNSKVSYLQYQIDTLVPSGGGAGLTTANIFTASNTFDAGLTTDQILVDGATLSIGEPATTTTMIGDTNFSTQVPTCAINATTSTELCNYDTVVNLIAGGSTPSLGDVMLVDNDASADLAMGVYHIIANTLNGIDTTTDLSIGSNITAGDINIGALVGIGDVNIYSQAVFDLPPHVPTPLLGNDAASKGYVDTLIGNYSGSGLNLYLNYSQPSINVPGAYILSTTVSSAALGTETTQALGTHIIASFATITGFPNLLTLPIGLWQMTVYGYVSGATGTLFYSFKLYQQPLVGAKVLIATSGDSSDVNAIAAVAPDAFHMSAAITAPFSLALTDTLLVEIISVGTGMGAGVNLNTVFEDGYYSFVNTNLSGGTSLLTTNNNWTGINYFSLGVQTGAIDTPTIGGLTLGTVEATSINIGRAGVNTTVAGTLISSTIQNNLLQSTGTSPTINHFAANTGGTYNLFTGTGRTGTTNIQTAGTAANIVNIGSATSSVNITGAVSLITSVKGTGTSNLVVAAPIQPSTFSYVGGASGTGTTANAIGQRIYLGLTALSLTTNAASTMPGATDFQITAGVWYIQLQLVYNNPSTSTVTTYQRVVANIGSGAVLNTNSDVAIYTDTNVVLGISAVLGNQRVTTFGGIFPTAASTYISVSVRANTPTVPLPLSFGSCFLSATRIA